MPQQHKRVDPETATKCNLKCVCAICTCGKHNCPKAAKTPDPGHYTTTHGTDYKAWQSKKPVQPNMHLPYKEHNYDTGDLMTSYKHDYVPKKLPTQYSKPQERYVANNQPFTADSEYKLRYQGAPITKQPNLKNQGQPYQSQAGGFNATSTYKDEYTKHPLPKKEQTQRSEKYFRPTGETGQSMYKQEFKAHTLPPQRPKTQGQEYRPTAMTEKESMYKNQYKAFDPKLYKKDVCPVEKLPNRPQYIERFIDQSAITRQGSSNLYCFQKCLGLMTKLNKILSVSSQVKSLVRVHSVREHSGCFHRLFVGWRLLEGLKVLCVLGHGGLLYYWFGSCILNKSLLNLIAVQIVGKLIEFALRFDSSV